MTEKMNELFKNEEFCVRYFDALEDQNALKALLAENGVVVTDEELNELVKVSKAQMEKAEGDELNEDALSDVSGGVVGWVVAGVASGIFFGYQVYKARRALNNSCKR